MIVTTLSSVCAGMIICSDAITHEVSASTQISDQVKTVENAKRVYTLVSENDLFGGTDRNYSNGLRFESYGQAKRTHPILKRLSKLAPHMNVDESHLWQGFGIGHSIFTPSDISSDIPDPNDHPYAGWLHFSGSVIASSADHTDQHALGVNFGVLGPMAQGKFVQREFHALIDGEEPRGWDYQLDNELGIEILAHRTKRMRAMELGPLEFDSAATFGMTVGNVHTHMSAGGMVRLGVDLDSDWGPPRIRPAVGGAGVYNVNNADFGGYLFLGWEGRYVVRNIFLDGNTFADDGPRVTGRRRWVGDIQGGLALNTGPAQIAFTYVHRTEQFRAQNGPDRFGAVSISIGF